MDESQQLLVFIKSLSDFKFIEPKIHNNMAATIVDGIFQAGINYDNVVKPRIEKIKSEYSSLNTTSKFFEAIQFNKLEIITPARACLRQVCFTNTSGNY